MTANQPNDSRRPLKNILSVIAFVLIFGGLAHSQEPRPLFVCETNQNEKYLAIYGIEQGPDEPWTDIQYRFGTEGQPPEMVFPKDPAKGAKSLFFSHRYLKNKDYYVSVRFVSGGYTYRVFSRSKDGAGVTITDAKGKEHIVACIERPYMFPTYLQRSLACDMKNPQGKGGCGRDPR